MRLCLVSISAQEPDGAGVSGDRRGLLMAARLYSARLRARVLICPWYNVVFGGRRATDGVAVMGRALSVDGETVGVVDLPRAVSVDALLFYPVSVAREPRATRAEWAGLAHLAMLGLLPGSRTRYGLARSLLMAAAHRGVVTNATGRDGSWGTKDALAAQLEAYATATGKMVPHPRTWSVRGSELSRTMDELARTGLDLIVKPANGARGVGISVVLARDARDVGWAGSSSDGAWVVQELLSRPLLVEGHKADLRCFALIDTADRRLSYRPELVLVRPAPAPYARGHIEAELTNTAYRRRSGLPTANCPLALLDAVDGGLRATLARRLDDVVGLFLDAYFWRARPGPRRVMLWGLDVFASVTGNDVQLYLLEANVYPSLLPNRPLCEPYISAMLRDDYLPAVQRAAASGGDAVPTP